MSDPNLHRQVHGCFGEKSKPTAPGSKSWRGVADDSSMASLRDRFQLLDDIPAEPEARSCLENALGVIVSPSLSSFSKDMTFILALAASAFPILVSSCVVGL